MRKKYNDILQKLKENGVNNRNDRLMVAHLINFIHSKEEKNIVKYIITKIKDGKIKQIYDELTSIYEFGPKITSLILRDIVFMYINNYEEVLTEEDYYYLQPVDTWVHQVSKAIGMIDKENIYKDEAIDIVNFCFKNKIDPIEYNQGAWYVGSKSFEILIKLFEDEKF